MAVNTTTLFPPVVDSTIPAFTGSYINFPVEISEYSSWSDIKNVQVTIRDANTNLSVLDSTKYPTEVMLVDIQGASPDAYVTIDNSDIQGGFQYNTLYKVQLRFTGTSAADVSLDTPQKIDSWLTANLDYFSEWSSICIMKYISEPELKVSGFIYDEDDDQLYWSQGNNQLSGTWTFSDGDKEKIKSYEIIISDSYSDIIEDSGLLYTSDNVNPNSFTYTLKYDFAENTSYSLDVMYTTQNGYQASEYFDFKTGTYSGDEPIYSLKVTDDVENGLIKLNVKGDIPSDKQSNRGVRLLIKRTSSKTNFTVWENLRFISFLNQTVINYIYSDTTIESGVFYKYAIQEYNSDSSLTPIKVVNKPHMIVFDDMFISTADQQLKVKFNPSVSSLKRTISETKTETLGSKYPFIKRNGYINYMQFPISGLIAHQMDEDSFFVTDLDLYQNKAIKKLYEKYNDSNNIGEYNNYNHERLFREAVMDFLYDGKPKLFRSTTEGNYLVQIMDISLSPETTLGRMIYSFSGTAYEIGDAEDIDVLVENGIIKNTDQIGTARYS